MSKIIGVTVGTPLSADKIKEKIKPVLSVDGVKADAKGDVKVQRTHWKEVEPMVSLFNRSDVGYEYTQADRIGLEVGETYEVYYNGNTYDAVGTAYTADGEIGVTLKKADGTIPGCTIIDFSSKTAERIGYGFRISKPVSQYQTVTIIGPRITWHKLERGYLPDEAIQEAVEVGLEEAKASGKFDGPAGAQGEQGKRGPGVLKITTAPTSYTTAIGDYTPKYRILLSTVKTQSGVDEVLVGDTLLYTYYNYKIDYISGSYAYISATRNSIRGAAGEAGANGNDGYSPTVAVADITGGHRVTITDVNGTQTFDVMDGKDGAGGSGGGVTDYNKLENKPVGVDVVELLPEITVEIDPDAGNAEFMATVPLVEGQTYTVKYNGVDYECVCSTMTNEVTFYLLGNSGAVLGGDDTGEPFAFMSIPDEGVCNILALDGSTSVTLSIIGEIVKTLDGKYLPEGVPYSEPGVVDILPEMTVEVDPESGTGFHLDKIELVTDKTYQVKWNGTEYNCAAQAFEVPIDEDGNMANIGVVIGDAGVLMGEEPTGSVPFVIIATNALGEQVLGVPTAIQALDGSTSVTLSISGEGKVAHKMDADLLPNGTPGISYTGDVIIAGTTITTDGGTLIITEPVGTVIVGSNYEVRVGDELYYCVAEAARLDNCYAFIGDTTTPFQLHFLTPEAGAESGAYVYGGITPGHDGATLSISAAYTVRKMDERCMAGANFFVVNTYGSSIDVADIESVDMAFSEARWRFEQFGGIPILMMHGSDVTTANCCYFTGISGTTITFWNYYRNTTVMWEKDGGFR